MSEPLVSVICVCYNHAAYVCEALDSVINQSYRNIELIVIDDGSVDGSGKVIKQWVARHPETIMLLNGKNIGYTKTFNKAFQLSKGEFIIDLSADDVLMPRRVEEGLALFEAKGDKCGVVFSDAEYIDESGKYVSFHSDAYPHHKMPQGDIYKDLIERFFICSPTMMIRSNVLKEMNGYDESLAFEDFDLWIRASRNHHFYYCKEPLVKKRILDSSLSKKQFRKGDAQRWSTLEVCRKIKSMNKTSAEERSLRKRVIYEIILSLRMGDFKLALAFTRLLAP